MLDRERKYFDRHRSELISRYLGKFVLIKNDGLIGIFGTAEEALSEGARRFGMDSFLVRPIEEADQIIYLPALTLGILRADSTHPI